MSCFAAYHKYLTYLENQKKTQKLRKLSQIAAGHNKNTFGKKIEDLRKKKKVVQENIDSLTAAADDFADKAESFCILSFIAESNGMRKAAKERN